MKKTAAESERQARRLGYALFFAALALYLSTMAVGPAPGEPARMLADHLGLTPFRPLVHPLWNIVVLVLHAVPLGAVWTRLSVFSALCGAASVWVVFDIVRRIPHNRTGEERMAGMASPFAQQLSGAVAAAFLAVSAPFWIVSTRSHPGAMDVLLLLVSVLMLFRYAESPRLRWLIGWALVTGAGCAEFATLVVYAPFMGVVALWLMYQSGQLRSRTITAMAVAGVVGLSLHAWTALRFYYSPTFEWRAFHHLPQVFWHIGVTQYHLIAGSVPKVGWMVIATLTAVPALVIFAYPSRSTVRSALFGSIGFHFVCLLLALGILFNMPVAPWPMLRYQPLLITPYALTAVWAGYLAGYVYIVLLSGVMFTIRNRSAFRALLRRGLPALWGAALIVAAWLNAPQVGGRALAPVYHAVERLLSALEGRDWLLTQGVLDPNILLQARARGIDLRVIDLNQQRNEAYMAYVTTLFDDARLRGLAQAGLMPMLREWLASDPEAVARVASFGPPDAWVFLECPVVPDRLVFKAFKQPEAVDPDAWMAIQRTFWSNEGTRLRRAARANKQSAAAWLSSYVARLANDVGVFMEDRGRPEYAREAYEEARRLDPDNLSALLNLYALARTEEAPEAEAMKAQLDRALMGVPRRAMLWSLGTRYGYVRNATLFVERGMAWAMSGRPQQAMVELKRASELAGTNTFLQSRMAGILLAQDHPDQSEALYLQVLENNPNDIASLLGLTRLYLMRGDTVAAEPRLEHLRYLGVPPRVLLPEEAVAEVLAGRPERAKSKLFELTELEPGHVRAWILLLEIAQQQEDAETAEAARKALRAQSEAGHVQAALALASLAMREGRPDEARTRIEEALKASPNSLIALDMMIDLCYREGKRDEAERYIHSVLYIDPNNPKANLMLGSIQYARDQLALAEASYRASLKRERSAAALNDLAWVLHLQGKNEEAEPFVREALRADERSPTSWDTLGAVLLAQGRVEEAERAVQQALGINPNDPSAILHMARIYHAKGMREQAIKTAETLNEQAPAMDPRLNENVQAFLREARAGR